MAVSPSFSYASSPMMDAAGVEMVGFKNMARMVGSDPQPLKRACEVAEELNKGGDGKNDPKMREERGILRDLNNRKLARYGYSVQPDESGRFYVRDWKMTGMSGDSSQPRSTGLNFPELQAPYRRSQDTDAQ